MSLLPFPLIDPHIHQWDPAHTPHKAGLAVQLLGRYPRILDAVARATQPKAILQSLGLTDYALAPYLPQNYALDVAPYQVDAVVHVEADWHHQHGVEVVEETRWLMGLPFGHPLPRLGGIVAKANPLHPSFEQVLRAHRDASPLFRGIRYMGSFHPDPDVKKWCPQANTYSNPIFRKRFALLAKYGLSFDAWAYSLQLPEVIALAKAHPEVPLVIDHLATPVGLFGPIGRETGRTVADRAAIFSRWQNDIAQLAELPHVHAKVSGLLMPVLGHDFHLRGQKASMPEIVERLSPMVDHAVKVFGVERLMFASNFPMDKVTASLPDIITATAQMIAPHGEAALKAVFRDNALRFYRLDCPDITLSKS
jgi:predicted TIM-barrel fold metal-dependent hydrolase